MRQTLTHPVILFILSAGNRDVGRVLPYSGMDLLAHIYGAVRRLSSVLRLWKSEDELRINKDYHELTTYQFTPDAIRITGESYTTTMQWKTLYKARELHDWFLLYCNKQTALLIPKSGFASASELAAFRGMSFTLAGA